MSIAIVLATVPVKSCARSMVDTPLSFHATGIRQHWNAQVHEQVRENLTEPVRIATRVSNRDIEDTLSELLGNDDLGDLDW